MDKIDLTADRLRELLHYDPDTGVFRWAKKHARKIIAGQVAGTFGTERRRNIKIDGYVYKESRLAWLYVHGKWPENVIDHINGDPSDNRIVNLRDVTQSGNTQNQRKPGIKNTTGYLGVMRRGNLFQARIKAGGKLRYLGHYESPELAHAAYIKAKRELHPTCTI